MCRRQPARRPPEEASFSRRGTPVTRLLITGCTFILGSLGWYAGEAFGTLAAFVLSVVGTGAGVYVGRRLADRWGF